VDRPSIKTVVQMLEREEDKLTIPPNPFVATGPIKISANIPTKRVNHELEVIPESE
jgi:glutaminase